MLTRLRLLIAVAAMIATTGWVTAAYWQEDPLTEKEVPQSTPAERYREGAKFQKISGWFKVAVDRVEFHPTDGSSPLVVLENLALERVVNELTGDLVLIWHVDGTLTEYHGRNYLLIDRAFVRSARER